MSEQLEDSRREERSSSGAIDRGSLQLEMDRWMRSATAWPTSHKTE
jgi:hypothetical protein